MISVFCKSLFESFSRIKRFKTLKNPKKSIDKEKSIIKTLLGKGAKYLGTI